SPAPRTAAQECCGHFWRFRLLAGNAALDARGRALACDELALRLADAWRARSRTRRSRPSGPAARGRLQRPRHAGGGRTMRLVHFSDAHVQLPGWRRRPLDELGPLRALATVELWKGRGRLFDGAEETLRR